MASWHQRSPIIVWLLRLSAARPRVQSLVLTGLAAIGLSIADAAGYLPQVSLAVAVFVIMIAAPQAVLTVLHMDENGQLDQLRLAGAPPASLVAALFWALVAPVLAIGGMFLVGGLVAGSVDASRIPLLVLAFVLSLLLSVGVLSSPSAVRTWAPVLLLSTVIVAAGFGAIASPTFQRFAWYWWMTDPGVLAAIGAAEVLLLLACAPRLARVVGRPIAGREFRPLRRLVRNVPFHLSPLLARGFVQSHAGALVSLCVSLAAIAGIRLFVARRTDGVIAAASAAAYLPLVVGILSTFNQSRLDVESGRFHMIRIAPMRVAPAAIQAISGVCLPYVLVSLVSGLAVWILLGSGPLVPIAAAMLIAMAAPAATTEAWLIPAKLHTMGLLSGAPFVLVAARAGAPFLELLTACLLVGWIPWAAAIAALRNPARPTWNGPLVTLAVGASTLLALQQTFVSSTDLPREAAMLAAALIVGAAWVGADTRGVVRYSTALLIVTIGALLIVWRSYPWTPGLSATATVAVGWLVGCRVERRWPRAQSLNIRVTLAYSLVIVSEVLQVWLPGKLPRAPADLMTLSYLLLLAILAMVAGGVEVASVVAARRLKRLA